MTERDVVACVTDDASYPDVAPFHAQSAYPEWPGAQTSPRPNSAYHAVRECFRLAGLDSERFGSPEWNPLAGLIKPGETVLLKPNLVKESHPRDPAGWRYVLTHGSIVRAAADYVWKAMEGKGKVVVADAPQTDSSFDRISARLGLEAVRDHYRQQGLDFELVDLRKEEWVFRDGVIAERRKLAGDPRGYVAFNLGGASEFASHTGGGRYYGADYDRGQVNEHHTGGRHEYLISGTAIAADVLFSLPKLKTHKKTGITVSLKNLVGINGDKNWLPHHTEGGNGESGDERPVMARGHSAERQVVQRLQQLAMKVPGPGVWALKQARKVGRRIFGDTEEVIRSGNWWGNDTTWRMCLDLNKIALYGNMDGTLREGIPANRKRHYSLVDGIIAGQGRGPMNPDPLYAGVVLFGLHPASVDAAAGCIMGFDGAKIPVVRQSFRCEQYPLTDWDFADVRVTSNRPGLNGPLTSLSQAAVFHFEPHFGWKGEIERKSA